MKVPVQRIIEVWADWEALGRATRMGTRTATLARGKEVFSFAYDPAWLKSGYAQSLDPTLRLFSGPQYPSAGRANFGMFLDSTPDRFGGCFKREGETSGILLHIKRDSRISAASICPQ